MIHHPRYPAADSGVPVLHKVPSQVPLSSTWTEDRELHLQRLKEEWKRKSILIQPSKRRYFKYPLTVCSESLCCYLKCAFGQIRWLLWASFSALVRWGTSALAACLIGILRTVGDDVYIDLWNVKVSHQAASGVIKRTDVRASCLGSNPGCDVA